MEIEGNSFTNVYKQVCKTIYENGEKYSPRNMNTKEIIGGVIRITNPRTRLLNPSVRNESIAFAIGEWLWCMQGRNDLEMIKYYAPSYHKYSDDNKTLHGAYGPRIKDKIPMIINILKEDPDSRRAVIPIYHTEDVGFESNDIPCTEILQFLIRSKKLILVAKMRSNDIYLGLPYDVFNFTMLQEYVASMLEIDIGTYTHMVGSMHFYEKDEEKIKLAIESKEENYIEMPKMPSEDINYQLSMLYKIEECIRNGESYDTTSLNQYFLSLVNYLIQYKKIKTEKEKIKSLRMTEEL